MSGTSDVSVMYGFFVIDTVYEELAAMVAGHDHIPPRIYWKPGGLIDRFHDSTGVDVSPVVKEWENMVWMIRGGLLMGKTLEQSFESLKRPDPYMGDALYRFAAYNEGMANEILEIGDYKGGITGILSQTWEQAVKLFQYWVTKTVRDFESGQSGQSVA